MKNIVHKRQERFFRKLANLIVNLKIITGLVDFGKAKAPNLRNQNLGVFCAARQSQATLNRADCDVACSMGLEPARTRLRGFRLPIRCPCYFRPPCQQ